jgi:glycine/D-amino acid oxidase-like deaminating enzyme
MRLDAVIFGGGAAGLWLLDRLSRDGHHVVLLESRELGAGQTVGSQAILHVGRTSTVNGLANRVVKPQRELPNLWRDALLGRIAPNLTRTRLRSECCYLWHADSASPQVTIADNGLAARIGSETLAADERPAALAEVAGPVIRLHEQVICPASFLADLADQYRDRLLLIDAEQGLKFRLNSPGEVDAIQLTSSSDGSTLELRPRQVIFTAGSDNARLRELVGLGVDALPSRPLHMVLARGNLPELNGHCIDAAKTIVTVTSDIDDDGRTVWLIGGPLAENGLKLDPHAQAERVREELALILPSLDLRQIEWSTYRLDRAECERSNNSRREAVQVFCAGNVTTGCPTKLVLAPILAEEIADRASSPYITTPFDSTPLADWPRPETAALPWNEADRDWWTLADSPARQQPQRRAA